MPAIRSPHAALQHVFTVGGDSERFCDVGGQNLLRGTIYQHGAQPGTDTLLIENALLNKQNQLFYFYSIYRIQFLLYISF
jgi:hypothetical protein